MMLINQIDISDFNSKLLSRNITTANFKITNEWMNKVNNPMINKEFDYKYKEIRVRTGYNM